MGELVVGKPALRLSFPVSLPLSVGSGLALLYRAVPGSGLDPWLVTTRRGLGAELVADLDLLHGFSGRLLYYMEEPVMRFEPLRDDRIDASFAEFLEFLEALPAAEYLTMAVQSVQRVHRDLQTGQETPRIDDSLGWRRFLMPALTTAEPDEVIALLSDPVNLKARTINLLRGFWDTAYREEFQRQLPVLREVARLSRGAEDRGFPQIFAELTGSRLPAGLVAGLSEVSRVAFCPAFHLGTFVSYMLYPPEVVVFYPVPEVHAEISTTIMDAPSARVIASANVAVPSLPTEERELDRGATLECLRALADANRLRIVDLLQEREMYAQEIVGRLGIAQSAVSRHLAQLERAGLIRVNPRRGMKYYAIDADHLHRLATTIVPRGTSNDDRLPGAMGMVAGIS